ncbi:helix-turn-helix transcriptional regulator [Herbaspirillum sp. RV1423]|uniref:helix-turn-helix domain-containing protein n=1 Tax=Herbaspirillum sp. RV1423 TaxID=1443993 RepID=UPI0004ADBB5F|nr:helix-turn-helix transcriptional regulator [Herbaspirillum sp. RV1423]
MLYTPRYEALRLQLQAVRIKAQLTQTDLAQKMRKTQSYISKVENGERYVDVMEFIDWCEICQEPPNRILQKILKSPKS